MTLFCKKKQQAFEVCFIREFTQFWLIWALASSVCKKKLLKFSLIIVLNAYIHLYLCLSKSDTRFKHPISNRLL